MQHLYKQKSASLKRKRGDDGAGALEPRSPQNFALSPKALSLSLLKPGLKTDDSGEMEPWSKAMNP